MIKKIEKVFIIKENILFQIKNNNNVLRIEIN